MHEPTFKYRVTVGDAVATGNIRHIISSFIETGHINRYPRIFESDSISYFSKVVGLLKRRLSTKQQKIF